MSSIVVSGDTSGTVTLAAPAVAGTTTLTLPSTNGTIALTSQVSSFDAGTRLGFQQTAAPTGWTKDTTAAINDSILRFVTGTASSGGSTAFSTFNAQTATSAYTLATADIPSHSHLQRIRTTSQAGSANTFANQSAGTIGTESTDVTGGGGSHSHGLTTSIKYYDFIIASKN